MKVIQTKKKRIFANNVRNIAKQPVIISEKNVNNISGPTGERVYEVCFYCAIDQRETYKNKVKTIKIYLSSKPISAFNKSSSLFSSINMKNKPFVNDVIYDIVGLSEDAISKKFDDIVFLTDLNPQKAYTGVMTKLDKTPVADKIKTKNLDRLTDSQAFGTTKKIKIVPLTGKASNSFKKNARGRTGSSSRRALLKKNNFLRVKKSNQLKSINFENKHLVGLHSNGNNTSKFNQSFKSKYFSLVKKGIDPMTHFQDPDESIDIKKSLRGINPSNNKMLQRSQFRKDFLKYAKLSIEQIDQTNDYLLETFNVDNRIKSIQKKITINQSKMSQLNSGRYYILFFAYDENNNIIDTDSYGVNGTQVFKNFKVRPVLDFDIKASRNKRKGYVSSTISAKTKETCKFNLYAKSIQPMSAINSNNFIEMSSNNSLFKGKRSISRNGITGGGKENSKAFHPNTPVFIRTNFYFGDIRVDNSKSASVGSKKKFHYKSTCKIYARVEGEFNRMRLYVHDIPEDVLSIRVVKRRLYSGRRSNKYLPILSYEDLTKENVTVNSLNQKKFTFTTGVNKKPIYTFTDINVKNDETYEYAVEMMKKTGIEISTVKYIERYLSKKNVISIKIDSISKNVDNKNLESYNLSRDQKSTISIKLKIEKSENDSENIFKSLFGGLYDIFKDELKDTKGTAGAIYSIQVHRINTSTGLSSFVGNFSIKDDNTCIIIDRHALSSTDYVYKFSPRVMPPDQALDLLTEALPNLRKNIKFHDDINLGYSSLKSTLSSRALSNVNNNNFLASRTSVTVASSGKTFKKVPLTISNFANRRYVKKGIMQPVKAITQKSDFDLFTDAETGDIVYSEVFSNYNAKSLPSMKIKRITPLSGYGFQSNIGYGTNNLKDYLQLDFTCGNDSAIDFYIILKRDNIITNNITIDGVMHSRDDFEKDKKYTFLSKCNNIVGVIEYFIAPVTKGGQIGYVKAIGKYHKEDK